MTRRLQTTVLLGLLAFLAACTAMRSVYTPLRAHPDTGGEDLRICTECHESSAETIVYERFVHSGLFAENHGPTARRQAAVCRMCHRQSDCDDCHGVWVELKPSTKNQTENHRRMPHRGDYLTRHVIDARVNPAPCYRCHGNPETARTCRPCHG